MDTYITFESEVTAEDSCNLQELANLIKDECDLSLEVEKKESKPGIKDGGLVIGIAIASLTLALIQTLIQVLQYWESQQETYSISITFKNLISSKTIVLKNQSLKDINSIIEQLSTQSQINKVEVKILKD